MSTLETLKRLAGKRVNSPQHLLCEYLDAEISTLRHDQFLVPESFTLGYHTRLYSELGEDERLALNHWIYSLMYTRISDGEIYVTHTNRVVSAFIRPHAQDIANLLDRETAEEHDHIAAFQRMKDTINEHYGVDRIPHPKKPARKLLIHPGTIKTLLRTFGVDFVITYFVGRGIANHMGMGFERPVGGLEDNPGITRMSLLHTQDESQHMAVSRLMASSARQFLPASRRGAIYSRMFRALQRQVATYTFSEEYSKALERRMCHRVVPHLRPLRQRSAAFVRELVDAHFESVSGIERSRNKTLSRDNQKLIDGAALDARDKQLWRDTLTRGQGNLRFVSDGLPVGSAPSG